MFCFPLEPAGNKLTSNKISTHKKHEAHHGWAPYRLIKNVSIRIHWINDSYVKKYNTNINICKVLIFVGHYLLFMCFFCDIYVHENNIFGLKRLFIDRKIKSILQNLIFCKIYFFKVDKPIFIFSIFLNSSRTLIINPYLTKVSALKIISEFSNSPKLAIKMKDSNNKLIIYKIEF